MTIVLNFVILFLNVYKGMSTVNYNRSTIITNPSPVKRNALACTGFKSSIPDTA